jgi:hypothetical protein
VRGRRIGRALLGFGGRPAPARGRGRGDGSGADVPAGARAPVRDAVAAAHAAHPPRARIPLPRRRRRALLPPPRHAHQLRAAGLDTLPRLITVVLFLLSCLDYYCPCFTAAAFALSLLGGPIRLPCFG